MKTVTMASALALSLASTPALAARPWWVTVGADYSRDDNINRGPSGQTLSDTTAGAGVEAGWFGTTGARSGLRLRLRLDANRHGEFDRLDRTRIEAEASWRVRPGHGYTATRLSFDLVLAGEDWRSKLRDASVARLNLRAEKRLTTRLQGRLGLGYEQRNAREETFTLGNALLEGYLDYRLGRSGSLYLTVDGRLGEAVTSLDPAYYSGGYGKKIDYTAWVADDAFRPGWWAYRIDADTLIVGLGYNHAFNRSLSLDLLARTYRARPRQDGPDYTGSEVSAALFYRFQ